VVSWAKWSPEFAAFLRGVSSGSIALMAVVMWRLGDEAFVDVWAIATFAVAFVVIRLGMFGAAVRAVRTKRTV